MFNHKIEQKRTNAFDVQSKGQTNKANRAVFGLPLKEKLIIAGIIIGGAISPMASFGQNNVDSSNVGQYATVTLEQTAKKSVYQSTKGLAYEYLVCYSGRRITLPSQLGEVIGIGEEQVNAVTLFGSFELKISGQESENASRLILFDSKIAWINERARGEWKIADLQTVENIGMQKTVYEVKIEQNDFSSLKLTISQKGASAGSNVYGVIEFPIEGDSYGVAQFVAGNISTKIDGYSPITQNMWDGYPQYKPQWKEMRIALPREEQTMQ